MLTTPVELKRSTVTGEFYIKLKKLKYDHLLENPKNSIKQKNINKKLK